jgi:endonuclease-8
MPEGPEILYSSIVIKKIINDYNFTGIIPLNKKVDIPTKLAIMIKNKKYLKVINVNCKGKLLWIELKNLENDDSTFIHIHYRLYGWIYDIEPDNYVNYILKFEKTNKDTKKITNKFLYMKDQIKLNTILFMTQEKHDKAIEELGIDIFTKDFTENIFSNKILSKKCLLANFLLNQNIICGIGNYIKNDAMYLAKLNVFVKTCDLTKKQISELYKNILFIAYSQLITHKKNVMKYLQEYKKENKPKNIESPYKYKVYGQKETFDGKEVIRVSVSGRGSFSTQEYIEDKKSSK